MTLLARIQALQGRLDLVGTLQERIAEAGRLHARTTELAGERGPLRRAADGVRLLRAGGVPPPAPAPALALAGRHLEQVRTRFTAARTAESLTRGQDWDAMLARTRDGVREATSGLVEVWRKHVDGLFAGTPPDVVAAQLAPTDGNKAALVAYGAAWKRWRGCAGTLPASAAALAEAAAAAADLRHIDASFDRAVPPAVKRFLDAVGQGGASLDLVTDDVQDWLRSSGSHARYRVVAARA
jgi:hypothetical protein